MRVLMQWKSSESVTFTLNLKTAIKFTGQKSERSFTASQESPNEILKLLLIAAVSGVFLRLEIKRERRGNERERDEGMRESEREEGMRERERQRERERERDREREREREK